jgi:hypothetical protein
MVRTWTLSTVYQRPLYISPIKHSPQIPSEERDLGRDGASSDGGDSGVGRDDMMLIVVMVVVMIIKVVLGALTEFPIHVYPDLATHHLAPSIPVPPTTHKRPVP